MMRDLVTSGLAIPLIVVALLAAMLGFFVTERVAPPLAPTNVRVSVVGLPRAATPSPSPVPTESGAAVSVGGGGGSGSGNNCPAGCECSGQPRGIVVICR